MRGEEGRSRGMRGEEGKSGGRGERRSINIKGGGGGEVRDAREWVRATSQWPSMMLPLSEHGP